MYCKHCGKEIADDSKFCQHCGGKLDNVVEVIKGEVPIDKKVSKLFSNINKKYLYAYIIWVIINTILLCLGDSDYSTDKFYPFTGHCYTFDGIELEGYFNSGYYDLSEFLTYVILIPLLVWLFIKSTYKRKVIPLVRFIKTYGIMILVLILIVVASIMAISRCSDEDYYSEREYNSYPNYQTQQTQPTQDNHNYGKEKEYDFNSQMEDINRKMKSIQQQQIKDLPSEYDNYYRYYP